MQRFWLLKCAENFQKYESNIDVPKIFKFYTFKIWIISGNGPTSFSHYDLILGLLLYKLGEN